MTDSTPVGAVRGSLYLPPGYVKINGATVYREDYPRLVKLADDKELWTNDTTNNAGLFGVGDGTTTMVLPNWVGRMEQLSDTAGMSLAAGLPNIKGEFAIISREAGGYGSGAFSHTYSSYGSYAGNGNTTVRNIVTLNASRSSSVYSDSVTTVQPPAIKMLPIMRY